MVARTERKRGAGSAWAGIVLIANHKNNKELILEHWLKYFIDLVLNGYNQQYRKVESNEIYTKVTDAP